MDATALKLVRTSLGELLFVFRHLCGFDRTLAFGLPNCLVLCISDRASFGHCTRCGQWYYCRNSRLVYPCACAGSKA